jgi:hypothetical protein
VGLVAELPKKMLKLLPAAHMFKRIMRTLLNMEIAAVTKVIIPVPKRVPVVVALQV